MAKEKYFIATSRSNDLSSLIKQSSGLMVNVYLSEEKKKEVHIYLTKNQNENIYGLAPKTDEFSIVKSSSKDDFDRAYNFFLKTIHQAYTNDGEFYLMKRNNGHPNGMAWYSNSLQNKKGLHIQFYDDPKDFLLRVEFIKTWQGVQHFRRAGNTISAEKFNLYFRAALMFLHDTANYSSTHKKFVQQFSTILAGETTEIVIETNWTPDNSLVVEKLSNRIFSIEKRLIEIDNDSLEERFKMRGELEGLKFALFCLQH